MSPIIPSNGQSPFDAVCEFDGQGNESWSARTLMPLMSYPRWQHFEPVIERAMNAARNVGDTAAVFTVERKNPTEAGGRPPKDYRLSRAAAYYVAMNGDPAKPEVAAAQAYFVRQTRQAETMAVAPALPDMSTPQGRIAVAQALLAGAERELELTEKVAELEPKALAHDTFLSAQKGDLLVRQAAKALGWQEKHLRVFLLDEKLIYRRERVCGGGEYDFYAGHAAHFNSVLTTVEHTWGACAHYTLNVTPRGMVLIQRRIEQQQSAIRASIEGGASR